MLPFEAPTSLAIHQFVGLEKGPKLIVFGAVHGNETCGSLAIRRVLKEIEEEQISIARGTLTMVPVANPLAYQLQQRWGERDLNRNMCITDSPKNFEDKVSNNLCKLLREHDALLDLHSFHTPGTPFGLFGPPNNDGELEPFRLAEQELAMARQLGVDRFVEGWLETYAQGVNDRHARGVDANVEYGVGTTETMRRYGGFAVTLECGQHQDKSAPQVAYDAILRTLVHLNIVNDALLSGIQKTDLRQPEVIRLYQVVDRLHDNDQFSRPWQSFEKIEKGERIAVRQNGEELFADKDGWIVFPNPDARVNEEWFYLAEASDRFTSG